MTPKKSKQKNRQRDLFRPELTKMIDPGHGLVKLAKAVNWDRMDEVFGETFNPDQGLPGISTRLMVSLHYLKYTHNLSDDDVVSAWVENPYWQYLGGRFLKNRPHFRFYASGKFFQKISASAAKKLMLTDRLSRPIPQYESHGLHDRRDSQGRTTLTGLGPGVYPTAFGRIFIPLNTLKAAPVK